MIKNYKETVDIIIKCHIVIEIKVIFKIGVYFWIFKKVESVPSGIAPKLDIASTNMNAKGWCFRTNSATFIKNKSS